MVHKISTFTRNDGSSYVQYDKLTTIAQAKEFFLAVEKCGNLNYYFTGGFGRRVGAWADESLRCGPQYCNQSVSGWGMVNSGLGLPYIILDFHPEHTFEGGQDA